MRVIHRRVRLVVALATVVTLALSAALLGPAQQAAAATRWVTVGGDSRVLDGTNTRRGRDELVRYTRAGGARTGTGRWGIEVKVVRGEVTLIRDRVGNMGVPRRGYVLSANGQARTWLKARARVDGRVRLFDADPSTPPGLLLPDLGIRTLRAFSIEHDGETRMLKFPGVTSNVGDGPMRIRATRSSSTSTDWVARQRVLRTDGSWAVMAPSAAEFFFAGDGHAHWHIRDFDAYELYDETGAALRVGEKHGFCFFDNTPYRDWVGSPEHLEVPTQPVYTHDDSCGEDEPAATSIVHGLSVGWSDTYPTSLPDQGIDITGLPDGTYLVKVTADWQDLWDETDETNNSASATIRIEGDTVTLLSATDGL